MTRHQFLIDRLVSFETRSDLPEAELNRLLERYADLYWQAVGVPPDFREELRTTLETIAVTGERPVAEVMQEIRHRIYSSPLGSGSADGGN